MTKSVFITQAMYFPWLGFFDLARLSDCFVHYDDVVLGRGFYNRVQIKTKTGPKFLSVPISGRTRSTQIDQAVIDNEQKWPEAHKNLLRESYKHSPYFDEMMDLFNFVHKDKYVYLHECTRASIRAVFSYLGMENSLDISESKGQFLGSSASARLVALAKDRGAEVYVTAHGGLKYLEHSEFEQNGIGVKYPRYRFSSYDQPHGEFTPYVSVLDLIACEGPQAKTHFKSTLVDWRVAVERTEEIRPRML